MHGTRPWSGVSSLAVVLFIASIVGPAREAHAQQQAPATPDAYPAQQPPAAQQTYAPPPQQQYPQQQYQQQQYQQQQPPPGYAYQQPQQPYVSPRGVAARRRPSRGLMIAGISVLASSYVVATAIGAGMLDSDSCNKCNDVAPWLFLPVAGPFVGMAIAENGKGALWFLGMVEAVGAALTIGGAIRYANTKREYEGSALSWKLGERRTLALDLSTSPMMAGPHAKLRF